MLPFQTALQFRLYCQGPVNAQYLVSSLCFLSRLYSIQTVLPRPVLLLSLLVSKQITYTHVPARCILRQRLHEIGSIWNRTKMGTFRPCVYTGPTGTVPNGTTSRTQTGPLTKSIPFGTVPRKVSCKRVERFQMGTARK